MFTRENGQGWLDRFSAGVHVPLGRDHRRTAEVRALHDPRGLGWQGSVYRHRQSPYGWSASALLSDLPGSPAVLSGNGEWATPAGSLRGDLQVSGERRIARAEWQGSLVFAEGSVFAGTPDRGPRVLVRSTAPDATLLQDNRPSGQLGGRGRLLQGIAPNASVTVSLDPGTLPLSADTSALRERVVLPSYGVVPVFMDTQANGQVEGVLTHGGKPLSLGILVLDDQREILVGETGKIWLESGRRGQYSGQWTDGQKTLRCDLVLDGKPLVIVSAQCP